MNIDSEHVPPRLRPLIPFVAKWAPHGNDEILAARARFDSDVAARKEIHEFAAMLTSDLLRQVDLWFDSTDLQGNESMRFYHALAFLDELELLKTPPMKTTTALADLQRISFGARLQAAKWLGENSATDIPVLDALRHQLSTERDHRVVVWLHWALFCGTQNEQHVRSLLEYLDSDDDEVVSEASGALSRLVALPSFVIPTLHTLVWENRLRASSRADCLDALIRLSPDENEQRRLIARGKTTSVRELVEAAKFIEDELFASDAE